MNSNKDSIFALDIQNHRCHNMRYYSPLRYPGGKNCIFHFVSSLLKENNLEGVSYAEPYAGGAGLALKLLFNNIVDKIYINDFDPAIYAVWDVILNQPDKFCAWIDEVSVDISSWKKYRKIQQDSDSSSFELAQATFFMNRTNVSGVIKGGVIGGLEQTGKYKIDARFNKSALIKRIKLIASRKKDIILSNLDGLVFLKKMSRKRKDVFVYIDPPYFQKGSLLYMNYYTPKDHEMLSKFIHKFRKTWLLSYDNNDFIINLYNERKLSYNLSQCASNRIGTELLVFSEKLRFDDSVTELSAPQKL